MLKIIIISKRERENSSMLIKYFNFYIYKLYMAEISQPICLGNDYLIISGIYSFLNEFNGNGKFVCCPIGVNFANSSIDYFTINYRRITADDANLGTNDVVGMKERVNMCLNSPARFTFIYLRLDSYLGVAHANFLLIENKTKKCLRIEPYGFQAGNGSNTLNSYIPTDPSKHIDVLLQQTFLPFGIELISQEVLNASGVYRSLQYNAEIELTTWKEMAGLGSAAGAATGARAAMGNLMGATEKTYHTPETESFANIVNCPQGLCASCSLYILRYILNYFYKGPGANNGLTLESSISPVFNSMYNHLDMVSGKEMTQTKKFYTLKEIQSLNQYVIHYFHSVIVPQLSEMYSAEAQGGAVTRGQLAQQGKRVDSILNIFHGYKTTGDDMNLLLLNNVGLKKIINIYIKSGKKDILNSVFSIFGIDISILRMGGGKKYRMKTTKKREKKKTMRSKKTKKTKKMRKTRKIKK